MLPKRPQKGKGHLPTGEFFALGSKPRDAETKTSTSIASSSHIRKGSVSGASSTLPIKRESSSSSNLLAKKPKILSQTFTPLGRTVDVDRRASPTAQFYLFEEIAKEVEPHELLRNVERAVEQDDEEAGEALICGAVKNLKQNRAKPEAALYLTLMYLAKHKPILFDSEVIIEALCSLLKRDVALNFKAKGNALVSVLACNVLTAAFIEHENWPDNFVKVYLEDSMGERVWVDRADCRAFTENIQSAFNSKLPKISMLSNESTPSSSTKGDTMGLSPVPMAEDEDSMCGIEKMLKTSLDEDILSLISPRYTYQQVSIEMYVLDLLREQLSRRQPMEGGSRNLLRVMTVTCGYPEVRTMGAQRLEIWLQSPKLTRAAQDLLMSVCMNCDTHSQQDIDIMNQLAKIRLKTKHITNHYLLCVKELLAQHPENLRTLLTHTIYNELSNSRNPNNMTLLQVMFQYSPDESAKLLAEIFMELLSNKEDFLRALRALLREIVRSVRNNLNASQFCLGLMHERTDRKFNDFEPTIKERMFLALSDLISLTILVTVTPAVREAASALARGDPKDVETLRAFQTQVAVIQRDAVWWLHTIVPKMFDSKASDYTHCLRKLLFVEKSESYYKMDGWPSENDRGTLMRLASEVPVQEDTLMRILVMGLTRDLHLGASDALDLADQLVRRAAMLHADDFVVLQIERLELIDALLNLCTYRHPENITLPKGYTPPSLAISNLYWKAWSLLLIITAFNPSSFGLTAWENYPTLKCLMEMTMTNTFRFPPPTMSQDEVKNVRSVEKQAAEAERLSILEFEGHLAAATSKQHITEANSLLLAQLTTMDPNGIARGPPKSALDQLRSLNQALRIGHLLCRSRSPDFLLDVIERQGTTQSMPWLADLVESNDSSLDVLPVQSLCEFLLHDTGEDSETESEEGLKDRSRKKQKQRKQDQLLSRLQQLLHSPASDSRTIREVLAYFLTRLSAQQSASRRQAVKGLSLVLSISHLGDMAMETEHYESSQVMAMPTHKWLLDDLPLLPQFSSICQQICAALRQACQVETDAASVCAYIVFLADHTRDLQLSEQADLAFDMAQLIVERATLMNYVLPQDGVTDQLPNMLQQRATLVLTALIDLFYHYLTRAQQPQEEAISWSNTQDQILLQWESGKTATLNIMVVQAMIILLTYPRPTGSSSFEELLEEWFPAKGAMPSAFLIDTSEEALLLPDWLKLRMIRSNTPRLVHAALMDLEAGQLLLFVQSFGIPLWSMSGLLACLDTAVVQDALAMSQSVLDKSYMAQLVEVQHMRGADGGHQFAGMLKAHAPPQSPQATDVEMKVAPRPRRISQLHFTPSLQPSQYRGHAEVVQLINKIFIDVPGQDKAECNTLFRTLHKTLTKDDMTPTVLQALKQALESEGAAALVIGMKKKLHFSCPLLRLFLVKQDGCEEELMAVMNSLSLLLGDSKSALSSLVTEFMQKQKSSPSGPATVPSGPATVPPGPATVPSGPVTVPPGPITANSLIQVLRSSTAEKQLAVQVAGALDPASVSTATQACSHMLLHGDVPPTSIGLLLDWLELLDPEVVDLCPDLEQQLVFGGGKGASCQPYLLSLLTHRSNWTTLNHCVELVLEDNTRLGETEVLDFLWACLHLPRIWRGRDPKPPKNGSPADILQLSVRHMRAITHLVFREMCMTEQDKRESLLAQRMMLLHRCFCGRRPRVMAAVSYINQQMALNRHVEVCELLLLEMYTQQHDTMTMLDQGLPLLTSLPPDKATIGQLDVVTCRLLSTLTNASQSKIVEGKMYDANIACRRLASQHPLLVLRQLPMLASLMQDKAVLVYNELRSHNHLLMFTQVLGILQLLLPFIFHPHYTAPWQLILQSYFQLLANHGNNRAIAPIINKFVRLVEQFASQDTSHSTPLLQKYLPILNDVGNIYPDHQPLRSLQALLTVSSHKDTPVPQPDSSSITVTLNPRPPRATSPTMAAQMAPFLHRMAKGNPTETVLEVLNELDETSKRKVDVLEHFMPELERMLLTREDACRNTAHALVMRYIRHNPQYAGQLRTVVLQCLSSDNHDVINSALKNLPEFVLLAQEHATELLHKAFTLGVQAKVETASYICDTLQLLNLETMN